ncbi:MAG TPA: hypothetical protein VFK06_24575 [Candidatus Angelobacter sp.]|nr:hypothetical protein [Candidatus Angelobacter sp.]
MSSSTTTPVIDFTPEELATLISATREGTASIVKLLNTLNDISSRTGRKWEPLGTFGFQTIFIDFAEPLSTPDQAAQITDRAIADAFSDPTNWSAQL